MTDFIICLLLSQKTYSRKTYQQSLYFYNHVCMHACVCVCVGVCVCVSVSVFEALRANTDNHIQVVKSSYSFREMWLAVLRGTWCEKSNPT